MKVFNRVFASAICLWCVSAAFADTPVRIARIMTKLPCKPQVGETLVVCPAVSNRSIAVTYDAQGDVASVGISIFAPEYKSVYNRHVCDCIERIYLELLLCKTEAERVSFLKEQGLRLVLSGFKLGSDQFPRLAKGIALLNENSNMSITESDGVYKFIVSAASGDEMQLTIPKDRELIFGTDKKEQDERLDLLLQSSKGYRLEPVIPQISQLNRVGNGAVWNKPGEMFMIDSLRNDTYFKVDGAVVTPLFDDRYPCESFCNLLLGQIGAPAFNIDINHKMYGFSIPRFNLSLADFIGFMREDKAVFYASARLIDHGKVLSGVLLINNPHYKYINLLTVTIPVADLFSGGGSILQGYLYTNVPQHNILNLFTDNNYKK